MIGEKKGDKTFDPEKSIYSGKIDIELSGISVGKAKIKVYEGPNQYGPNAELNEHQLVVHAVYNERKFEVTSPKGGIDEAVKMMKREIEEHLKKEG